MSRDKQIEEIAKKLYEANGDSYDTSYQHDCEILAEVIYNAGYRKASQVVMEMIENLANDIWEGELDTLNISVGKRFYNKQEFIAELKKKYTGEGK